jgi:hypothetical protein
VACDQAGSTAAFIADAPQRIPLPRRNRNLHAFDRNDLQELGADIGRSLSAGPLLSPVTRNSANKMVMPAADKEKPEPGVAEFR